MNCLHHSAVEFKHTGLFRSEKDWIHPERIEETFEIIYVTHGDVFLREEDRDYHLCPGDLLVLSPSVCHVGSKQSRDVSFFWVHFSVNEGDLPFSKRLFSDFEHASLFKELLHYKNLPKVPNDLVNAILLHILSELYHLSEQEGASPALSAKKSGEKIYEWLRINASAKLRLRDAALAFGYSEDHISRICKKQFGAGARELMDHFLLTKAQWLLCTTDLYVKEIAAQLAFSTDKSFLSFFRYHEGISPTEYRRRFSKIRMNNK